MSLHDTTIEYKLRREIDELRKDNLRLRRSMSENSRESVTRRRFELLSEELRAEREWNRQLADKLATGAMVMPAPRLVACADCPKLKLIGKCVQPCSDAAGTCTSECPHLRHRET